MSERVVLETCGESGTRAVAGRLARELRGGERIGLSGELGAGKTCFVRGLAEGLGNSARARPQPYVPDLLDLRRRPAAAVPHRPLPPAGGRCRPLGLREILYGDGVCAVEWFDRLERAAGGLPRDLADVRGIGDATSGGRPTRPGLSCGDGGVAGAGEVGGTDRSEIRRHIGRQRRAHQGGGANASRHPRAPATRSSWWSRRWRARPTACWSWPAQLAAAARRRARSTSCSPPASRCRSALVAIALHDLGVPARSFLGHQIRISTDSAFGRARIRSIDAETHARRSWPAAAWRSWRVSRASTRARTSRRSAAAAAIPPRWRWPRRRRPTCARSTPTSTGVYTTDPRICPEARKLERISYDEMLELASLGAKVLQIRSVEFAKRYQVPVHVRSSFRRRRAPGWCRRTRAWKTSWSREWPSIGTRRRSRCCGVPDRPGLAAQDLRRRLPRRTSSST